MLSGMSDASRVVNSAFLSVAAKLLGKTLGLLSTFIVARILTPEDFGFIAIVSMALYLFDILSHAAGEQYIVQKRSVGYFDLQTAWSFNLLLKLIIALVIMVCANGIAAFFDKPQLGLAIMASAIILPLQALKSYKLMLLKRQLRFKPLFWLSLAERVFALPMLITFALVLGNYWAFVITDVLVAMFGLIFSYLLVRGRPFFTLKQVRVQWAFSQWMLGKHLLGYARSQIDTFVVAKWFSTSLLGNYHMARDLAMMPAHYLLNPAIEPLLAVYKNDRDNKAELLNNVAFSLLVVFAISIPVLAVLALYAKPFVFLLLGEKWSVAAQLLPVLAILFFYWCIVQVLDAALIALNQVRLVFVFDVLSLALVALALLWALSNQLSLFELAWARAVAGLISALVLLGWVFSGYWQHLKPLLMLAIVITSMTGLAMMPIWLVDTKPFPDSNSTLTHYIQSAAELAMFAVLYSGMFALLLTYSKHYQLLRLKQLILQYLPATWFRNT